MPKVNINVSVEDWQATAAELAGENMRLRAALQAAGRELNQLASGSDGESPDEQAGHPLDDEPDDDDLNNDERKD